VSLYRPRRAGERKRKSARGCITGPDLAVIALKVLVKGEADVAGLTDENRPRRLGPKRANNIRRSFALRKQDDVRKYVVRRALVRGDKTFYKSCNIQRLITEKRFRRKKVASRNKKDRAKAAQENKVGYEKLLSKYLKEKKAAKKTVATPTPAPVAAKK
jgi:small subunit ribosomal protein S6e